MSDVSPSTEKPELQYAVIAEADGYPKQLVQLNLPFARLMDDIVVPYENGEPFFVDGVPVTKPKVRRIKIVQQVSAFNEGIEEIERRMTRGEPATRKTYGDQYETRFEHVLRTAAVDVTAQIVKAYAQVIKPSIKDYLPKREELIGTAAKVFVEALKALGS